MTDPSLTGFPLPVADPDADADALDAAVLGGRGPSDRARRAESLAQLVLGDPAAAAPLRELVRRAANDTGAETGQISLLSTRQIAVVVEKGTRRLPAVGDAATGATSAFEDTICAVSVRADAPICIPDTRSDQRVASVPAVVDGTVGSYLGSPVRGADGVTLGVLCVYNAGPHPWSPGDAHTLDALAAEVSAALSTLVVPAPAETRSA